MRQLKTADVFAACRTVKRLGLREPIMKLCEECDTVTEAFVKGFDLLWDVFDRATESKGENEIYKFLSGPLELTVDEIQNMQPVPFMEMLIQLKEENDLKTFFGLVRKMLS